MPALTRRVGALEKLAGSGTNSPWRVVLQFGGISEAEADQRHEAQFGPIDASNVMLVRGVNPGVSRA